MSLKENLSNEAVIFTGLVLTAGLVIYGSQKYFGTKKNRNEKKRVPISVNYHFSRKCNYECGFCFHTAKNSDILSLEQAKIGLTKLKNAGMRKINFAGGEPFLYPKFLGELVVFCKEVLQLESVSIISNGSLIKETWMNKYSKYLDILGISCDSFVEEINVKIGRGKGNQVKNIFAVRQLCDKFNIKFKLNTVVCKYNYMEDMNEQIARLDPFRWKCFQVLMVKTENDGTADSKRNVHDFKITDEEYEMFIKRHENQKCLIKESNSIMKSSYLILDEYMRFLDKGDENNYIISESILDVDVDKALSQIKWDEESFQKRLGEYDWTNEFTTAACKQDKELEW